MNNVECPFCSKTIEKFAENIHSFAIFDRYPVSKGHALVISKRHVSSLYSLNKLEQNECWRLVNKVREMLQEDFQADGFNIGINLGEAAGQTVFHTHIHIIPRYVGDVDNPRGGVRHVINGKGYY